VIGSIPIIGVEKGHCVEAPHGGRESSNGPREVPNAAMRLWQDEVLRDPGRDSFVRESIGNQDMSALVRLSRDGLKTLAQDFIAFAKIGCNNCHPHQAPITFVISLSVCAVEYLETVSPGRVSDKKSPVPSGAVVRRRVQT
jgi:hypothetical protein